MMDPPRLSRNLFLVGLRGTGKSTVGQLVATRLNVLFFDADVELETRTGRTPYERLDVGIKIVNGIAEFEKMLIEGSSVRIAAVGAISIPARVIDLKGTASLLSSQPGPAGNFDLPFVIQGPWDNPLYLADTQSLIRRSRAASPLLDAVRERRSRDDVRSATERLGGNPRPAPAVAGQPAGAATSPAAAAAIPALPATAGGPTPAAAEQRPAGSNP